MILQSLFLLLSLAQVSSAQICDEPQWWATQEPEYCLLAEPTTIRSPYFQVHVDAGLYVGLSLDGHHIVVLNDLEQRMAQLTVLAPLDYFQRDETISTVEKICGPVHLPEEGVLVCDQSYDDEYRETRFFLENGIAYLWIETSYLRGEDELKEVFDSLALTVQATDR